MLRMERIHLEFFRIWNDPETLNTEIMAPPGVGKTTCLYGQNLWDLAQDQRLRCVKMTCDLSTSRKRVGVVRMYADSPRFRALHPHIRIDRRQPDNSDQFTVVRPNIGSQDPTMIAKGAQSEIQGAGLERLDCDDLCPPRVRREASTRKAITEHFQSVVLTRRRTIRNSRVRYVATPWHVDDTTCRLQRDILDGKRPGWAVYRFPVEEDADGNPIPPISRPGYGDELRTIKITDPLTYACCYRLDPRDETQRRLKGLRFYDVEGGTSPLCPENRRDYYRKLLERIQNGEKWKVLDPAFGGRDQTAIVGFSKSRRRPGTAAITSAEFISARATEVIERVCKVVADEGTDKLLMESQGPQKGVIDTWTEFLVARLGDKYRDRIVTSGTRLRDRLGRPVGQNVSKSQRYYNAVPYLENGVVMFPGRWALVNERPQLVCCDEPGLRQLYDQLMNYPNVTRDDGIDPVSMFINTNIEDLVLSIEALGRKSEPAVGTLAEPKSVLTRIYRAQLRERKHGRNRSAGDVDREVLVFGEVA